MIPSSLAFAGDAVWLRYVLLSLFGLLFLYTLYTTLAVFYFVDENEISVFYCWKFYHFDYHSIKRDIYISPSSREKFLEVLKERRKGKTFKG